jgi:hypothetical protein
LPGGGLAVAKSDAAGRRGPWSIGVGRMPRPAVRPPIGATRERRQIVPRDQRIGHWRGTRECRAPPGDRAGRLARAGQPVAGIRALMETGTSVDDVGQELGKVTAGHHRGGRLSELATWSVAGRWRLGYDGGCRRRLHRRPDGGGRTAGCHERRREAGGTVGHDGRTALRPTGRCAASPPGRRRGAAGWR